MLLPAGSRCVGPNGGGGVVRIEGLSVLLKQRRLALEKLESHTKESLKYRSLDGGREKRGYKAVFPGADPVEHSGSAPGKTALYPLFSLPQASADVSDSAIPCKKRTEAAGVMLS